MNRTELLRNAIQDAQTAINEIKALWIDGRLPTDEEHADVRAKLEEIKSLKDKLKTEEMLAENAESITASVTTPPALAVIKDEADRGFRSMGDMLQAVCAAGMKAKYGESIGPYVCGVADAKLIAYQIANVKAIKAAASSNDSANETVPSEGGFMVGTDYSSGLIIPAWETALLPSKCMPVKISANSNRVSFKAIDETTRATGSRYGGVQVYMAAEANSVTEKKPKFRDIELKLNKMMGLTYLTDEVMQDAPALESWVTMMFKKEFGFRMDDLIINGTGSGQPLGILNAGCLRSVVKETSQTADTILWENVKKMYQFNMNRLTAEWYVNQECLSQLMGMEMAVGTGGVPVWLPAGTDRPYDTLLGRPINYIEQAAALGDVGDIIFADFGEYMFADKSDISVVSSIHVAFEYDETALRFTYRLDGQPILASAITPYKGASTKTYSPFVVTAAR